MSSFEELTKDYEVDKVLGKGSTGVVLHAVRKADHEEVAIKMISKHEGDTTVRTAIDVEADALKRCDSDRVVRLIEVLEDDAYGCEVIEFISGGDLSKQMSRRKQGFEEQEIMQIMEGVLEALVHLHQRGVAHRDLKLENIMLVDGDPKRAKIIDFGMAFAGKTDAGHCKSSEHCGTLKYSSPEMLMKKQYIPEKADMWSIGVVLYTLIARKLPFTGRNYTALWDAIVKSPVNLDGPEWVGVSEQTKELVKALLSKDQRNRPSAARCLVIVKDILYNDGKDSVAVTRMLTGMPAPEHKSAKDLPPAKTRGGTLRGFKTVFHRRRSRSVH